MWGRMRSGLRAGELGRMEERPGLGSGARPCPAGPETPFHPVGAVWGPGPEAGGPGEPSRWLGGSCTPTVRSREALNTAGKKLEGAVGWGSPDGGKWFSQAEGGCGRKSPFLGDLLAVSLLAQEHADPKPGTTSLKLTLLLLTPLRFSATFCGSRTAQGGPPNCRPPSGSSSRC